MSKTISVNDQISTAQTPIQFTDVLGKKVLIPDNEKPVLLSFFRFASCPFCNLRLRTMQSFTEKYPEIKIIAVFGSPSEEVAKAIDIHKVSFSLLADTTGVLYIKFGIRRSFFGMIKGMLMRMPTLLRAMFINHYIPQKTNGHLLTMPADFLINRDGVVKLSFYGKDEGDHVDLQNVIEETEKM